MAVNYTYAYLNDIFFLYLTKVLVQDGLETKHKINQCENTLIQDK